MSKNGLENGLDMFQRQQKFLWQQKFQLLKKVTYSRTYLVRSYVKKNVNMSKNGLNMFQWQSNNCNEKLPI